MGFGRLFGIMTLFTLLEAMVVARVAQLAGWGITLLALAVAMMTGYGLARRQGWATWSRLHQRVQRGEAPGPELVSGLLVLTGAFLLLVPGFITDSMALFLLFPPFRRALAALLIRRGALNGFAASGASTSWVYSARYESRTDAGPQAGCSRVQEDRDGHLLIEGEAERRDD